MTTTIAMTAWRPVDTGDGGVAVAERAALGTTARVAVWPPESLARVTYVVDEVLDRLDRQASRFRPDSELSWLHRRSGRVVALSGGLAEAVGVALAAARWTAGRVDPTIGDALIRLGYDRDFASLSDSDEPPRPARPAPGWQRVELSGTLLRLPVGVLLDLGATAKGVGSDRAARAAFAAARRRGGVLVSLGGDIAVAGAPPQRGWPVLVADEAGALPTQLVRLPGGGLATSSTTCRRWRRSGQMLHHIVDPRTGLPADERWQLASVAAATCADANAAATAAIVAGAQAEQWLNGIGLAARLVGPDGEVRRIGGWPPDDDGRLPVRPGTRVYGGAR